MRKFLSWAMLVLVIHCGAGRADERVLTVGIYDNPPQVFQDVDGTPRGIYVDLIRQIAALEKWEINFVQGAII